jgi:hypothetical protein
VNKMKGTNNLRMGNEKGFVLIICVVLLLMLSLIGIVSITSSTSDMKVSGNELRQTGSFYAAESGIERAAAAIASSYETTGNPPDPLPSGSITENNSQYNYATTDGGAAVQKTLDVGAYKGLYGMVKSFEITSTGLDNNRESSITLDMGMEDALIPLFQFAVFYENDLEIAPGPIMTLGGRVHSNKSMYLQSGNNLNIDSYLTSAGDILHGRKPGSGQGVDNGNVFIKDKNGVYQNMKNADGTWLDANSSDWVNSSLSRWGGLAEDKNHGINELYMPVITDGPPTDLIDRGSGNSDSYENKAGLKLIDGQAYYLQSDGNWLNVTSTLTTQGAISSATFRDGRETKDVNSLDLDIQKLNLSGYYPTNGVIYSSQQTVNGVVIAIRLKNGATLPGALTVATDNPMYTWGNFNTVSKKPAALLSDAITILSGNWSDARSGQSLSNRPATATQVNACYMTGNTETGAHGNGYNGGLENLPRFLENWSNITLTWRGSAVDLWYSRQATGVWSYGSYYNAPIRDWGFDPDLLNFNKLPPGTPLVNIVQRTHWSQRTYQASAH